MEGSEEFKNRGFPSQLDSPPKQHLVMLLHQIAGVLAFANVNVMVLQPDKPHKCFPVFIRNPFFKFIVDPV